MSETEKKRSKSSAGKVFCYVVGSVALCATACVVIGRLFVIMRQL